MLTDAQKWLLLAVLLLTGWLLYLLAPVLTPFLVAATLAYLGDPVVDRLEKYRITRTLAVVIVFLIMIMLALLLLLILIPLLQDQLLTLMKRVPAAIDWIQSKFLPLLSERFGLELAAINLQAARETLQDNWRNVGDILGYILGGLGSSGQWLLAWLSYLVLVPVVTFYLLRDWDKLVATVRVLIPQAYRAGITRVVSECDSMLAEFMRGQLTVMLSLGLIYSIGLWLAGLDFALLIGLGAGLISFIPYLGSIVGITVAGIVALIQFQEILPLIYVGLVFGIGQAIEGMLLSPWLVGERIGLHPVAVIFAVMAGGQLFGFLGVLLALPLAAVITVLLRHVHARYINSDFYTP
ncbi:MAG: AI-2E family transporter [Gammaproteobacteria bacterium]